MLHFLHPGIGISKIELGKSCHSGRSDNVEPESFGKIRSYEIPAPVLSSSKYARE